MKITNKILLRHYYDAVLDMEFLKGKIGYYMNQNFDPLSEDMKQAFYAGEQTTNSLGT